MQTTENPNIDLEKPKTTEKSALVVPVQCCSTVTNNRHGQLDMDRRHPFDLKRPEERREKILLRTVATAFPPSTFSIDENNK